MYRPIDLANLLGISTSTLRNYEARGLLPPPIRSTSNYRYYTKMHLHYVECIRFMTQGFGFDFTQQVLKKIQTKDIQGAFWLINEKQAHLFAERTLIEEPLPQPQLERMSIKEVAKLTKVSPSAIRHWEQAGLFQTSRQSNTYRTFTYEQVRLICLIRKLRLVFWSLEDVKLCLENVNVLDEAQVKIVNAHALAQLKEKNLWQMQGIQALYTLCQQLELVNM